MLYGIDISNWQKGLRIPPDVDFAIMKATGGTGYIDKCCDDWVQYCLNNNVLFGYYHFAGDGYRPDPEKEALFFWENTKGYNRNGIPVLDIEDDSISDWGNYAQKFVDKYHACSGVYPIIYTFAAALGRFSGYPLVDTCDLWIAGYPDGAKRGLGDLPRFPYSVSPWAYAAIWQYSANGTIPGWSGKVDVDVAYMDETAWHLYSDPDWTKDSTQILPSPTDAPEKDGKTWTLENSHVRVDVTLK